MPTILIADDSPVRRRIISSVLEQAEFDVVAVEDGLGAVQAVFRARPDLVILNAQLPRLSGHVVAHLLKDDWQTENVPIVIITADETAAGRYRGEQTGADRFLSKDFGAGELVATVHEVLAAAAGGSAGRQSESFDAEELADDDVLSRVSELLDRKLFEARICADVARIGFEVHGFEETVAAVLGELAQLIDFDLAAVCLMDTRVTYLTVASESSTRQYLEFCGATADVVGNLLGQPVMITDLIPRVADPQGLLGAEDEGEMASFLHLPLRSGGRVLGCLAVSSSAENAFGETGIDVLRLIEQPVADVISNAQFAVAPMAVADVA